MRRGLGKAGLYCDTVPSQATIRPGGAQAAGVGAHWACSRRRRGRWGAQAWALRARSAQAGVSGRAGGRCRQLGPREQGARQAGRRRGARGRQALGAQAGFGLCTRPFFGPGRLGIFPESPNEHCSL